MKLYLKIGLWVEGEDGDDPEQVRQRQEQIENMCAPELSVDIDESHWNDVCACLGDLRQIVRRAAASRKGSDGAE
jgi:hypothetical protein